MKKVEKKSKDMEKSGGVGLLPYTNELKSVDHKKEQNLPTQKKPQPSVFDSAAYKN